jgi:hypothetical protein
MTDALVHWIASTHLAHVAHENLRYFWVPESLHFIGMCAFLGAIFMVDIRLLGFIRQAPMSFVPRLSLVAVCGFLISFLSGAALFLTDSEGYWASRAFRIKMFLIVLAGINAALFTLIEQRKADSLPSGANTNSSTKVIGALSLIFWLAVMTLGRLLPYLDYEGG